MKDSLAMDTDQMRPAIVIAQHLLNHFGIGTETLEFAADRSTFKQGRLMPGTHVPIVAPNLILETMPGYLLLLSWNFADEILEQQREYRNRGGRFIIPLPEVKIV